MSKFTQGPWSYGTGNDCHDVYSKDGTLVCKVFENLSDRFLISKAPEMYELLLIAADISTADWFRRCIKLLKEIDN